MTRTRAGQWDPRLKRQGAKIAATPDVREDASFGSSALLAESETISFKIVFDATEAVLAGRSHGTEKGVLPQLAFLEVVSQGREGNVVEDPKKQDKTKEVIQPIRPDELLLVLGSSRIFPVVLTNLTITEQKFLPSLVPLRAEVDLKFTVLEPIESSLHLARGVGVHPAHGATCHCRGGGVDGVHRRRHREGAEHMTKDPASRHAAAGDLPRRPGRRAVRPADADPSSCGAPAHRSA